MIGDAEIRRIARETGMEPRLVDLDYTLGWALWGIGQHPYLNSRLLFKGGTCLRKCYFRGYRFSEDLDFTATECFSWDELEEAVLDAFRRAQDVTGIDFQVREHRLDEINDEYGRETLRFYLYFIGAHPRPNPRSVQLDITRNETVVFPPRVRKVHHEFSDAGNGDDWSWRCYALEEILAEKLRAVLGQRRHAIARDLYDIHALRAQDLDCEAVREALPAKTAARDMGPKEVSVDRMLSRRGDFADDWERNLVPLVPEAEELAFDTVWVETAEFVRGFTPIRESETGEGSGA